jgi:NADP-dependent 3-hydroxy acid dehydrogenase YdfG
MEAHIHRRTALVLGASGGIGAAVASALARLGVHSGLAGRDPVRLKAACSVLRNAGGNAIPIELDMADTEKIEGAVRAGIEQLGGLDYLINCAGVQVTQKVFDADLDAWDGMLDVNFRGFTHVVRHALPHINESPCGAIVSIGSITSAYTGAAVHHASKLALSGYCESLFEEVREFGTRVCVIRPGFVNTRMVRSDRLESSRMIQPEDIARTVIFVLQMPETACPTEITLRPQRTPYIER